MKIKLIIELELPDQTPEVLEEYNEALGQLLFDDYINYVTINHMSDAVEWCSKGRLGSEKEDLAAKQIYQHHKTWGRICRDATWNFEIVGE